MNPRDNQFMPFEMVLQDISTNNPDMKKLVLSRVIINPIGENGRDIPGNMTISHRYDESLFKLAAVLKENNTLEHIVIDGIDSTRKLRWTETGALAIGESLKNHPELNSIHIDLDISRIGEREVLGFLHALTGSAPIRQLWINIYCDSNRFLNQLGNLLAKKHSLQDIFILGSNHKNETSPLTEFFTGIGSQKELSSLSLNLIKIDRQGLDELARCMKDIHSLKKIEFSNCGIYQKQVKPICDILKNNLLLHSLNLSYNPLEDKGVEEVVKTLPLLTSLKKLHLNKVNLTNLSLASLTSTLVEKRLGISHLSLDSNPMDNGSISSIMKLIDTNPRLKNLNLDFCNISDDHFKKMAPLLEDPTKCLLEEFSFNSPQVNLTPATHGNLIRIMQQKNENLCLLPPKSCKEYRIASDINRRKRYQKKWNEFIDAVFWLSQAHLTPGNLLSKCLPTVMFFYILSYLVPDARYTNKERVNSSMQLIYNNLEKRRELIEKKEYTPSAALKKNSLETNRDLIKTWWSTSFSEGKHVESTTKPKTLFVSAETHEPYYLQLPEVLKLIKATLEEAKVPQMTTSSPQERIIIDLSHLSKRRQDFILNVFNRFLQLHYGNYSGGYPTLSPHAGLTETGKLMVLEISSMNFQALIDQTEESDLIKRTSSCVVM